MGSDLIGAHCIYVTPKDLKIMKEKNASILHCPRPYLLGGTSVPLSQWIDDGIKVGLGTDNVCHSMWETIRATLYAARVMETNTGIRSPSFYELLELATNKGAQILGRTDIGSLEKGKKADILLIDLLKPNARARMDQRLM